MQFIQRISLYLFFFSVNFEVWDPFNTGGLFSISKMMGFIYLATMLPSIVSFNTTYLMKLFLWPLVLFYGLLLVINLFNVDYTLNNPFSTSILLNIIFFYILINHEKLNPHILEKGILSFAFGSFVFALLFAAGIGIEIGIEGRVSVFGDNQNSIGIKMIVSVLIVVLTIVQNQFQIGKIRFLFLLAIPIMFQLLLVTGSRVAILSLILAFLLGIFLFKTKKVLSKIVFMAVGSLVFILVWQILMQSEVVMLRLSATVREGDLSGRDQIWKGILPLIKANPLFGVGATGYESFCHTTFGMPKSPHNVLLEVLCYTGLVGFSLYIIFLYRVFQKSLNLYKSKKEILPLLLLVPIFGIILSGQILEVKTGWIIFAYIAGNSLDEYN